MHDLGEKWKLNLFGVQTVVQKTQVSAKYYLELFVPTTYCQKHKIKATINKA